MVKDQALYSNLQKLPGYLYQVLLCLVDEVGDFALEFWTSKDSEYDAQGIMIIVLG